MSVHLLLSSPLRTLCGVPLDTDTSSSGPPDVSCPRCQSLMRAITLEVQEAERPDIEVRFMASREFLDQFADWSGPVSVKLTQDEAGLWTMGVRHA